ncbi:hypothetical protein GCM10020295_38570 [Streptomyces cinereospinus]
MRSVIVLDDIRVQEMVRRDGSRAYTIVWPDLTVDEEADCFLCQYEGSGTQKTYAYTLVDHLRWRVREGLTTAKVSLSDLQRYMGGRSGHGCRCRSASRGGCRRNVRTAPTPSRSRPPA